MNRERRELRTLLLQIRDDPRVRREEHDSFARYSGLALAQIEVLNVFDTPHFPPTIARGYDAVLVGGASEASVLEPETYAFLDASQELLQYCLDAEIPVFASCFGFQLAVIALGGTIIRDEADFEMGTIPIRLDVRAARDPLYRDVPDGFLAVAVHRERALEIPPSCDRLAYTPACCHSFRVRGKPFWTFQFHPEVDRRTLVERLTLYKAKYTNGDAHLERVLAAASETPHANTLVAKFVDRVLLGQGFVA